jgi:hypothetical protein
MVTVMSGIERALADQGYSFDIGAGVAATHKALMKG